MITSTSRCNIGKLMNKTKLLTKTMKIIEYERHVKGNKNGNSYEITNLNKICHEI